MRQVSGEWRLRVILFTVCVFNRLVSGGSRSPVEHLDLDDNSVTVGGAHACALERVDELSVGGEIVCWGDASAGTLDSPGGLYVQLSSSGSATCGVSVEQRVACWGGGAGGRYLVLGVHDALGTAARSQVSIGARHACALASHGGHATCWGDDSQGQVSRAPTKGGVAQVSCGGDACCTLSIAAGSAASGFALGCWGAADGGLVADLPAGPFLQVSVAADGHACAIAADFRLWCWGSFVSPMGGAQSWNGTFVQVAAAEGVSCALRADGTVLCLGEERRLWSGRATRGVVIKAGEKERLPPPRNMQFSEISAQ